MEAFDIQGFFLLFQAARQGLVIPTCRRHHQENCKEEGPEVSVLSASAVQFYPDSGVVLVKC